MKELQTVLEFVHFFLVMASKVSFCSYHNDRYHNDPKFSDRHVLANGVDPDQTAP